MSDASISGDLGYTYRSYKLTYRLAQPWFHLAHTPGKRDTYGLWYSVGGANPYGIMNYNDDLASSSSFAGTALIPLVGDSCDTGCDWLGRPS